MGFDQIKNDFWVKQNVVELAVGKCKKNSNSEGKRGSPECEFLENSISEIYECILVQTSAGKLAQMKD